MGQWAKKIRGRTHYFGPWHDPHGALRRYLTQKDDLEAGRQPTQEAEIDGELTVKQMVYLFLASKKLKVEAGETYRVVAVWKELDVYSGQKRLFDKALCFFYITNDREKAAHDIVFEANSRCNQEDLLA